MLGYDDGEYLRYLNFVAELISNIGKIFEKANVEGGSTNYCV